MIWRLFNHENVCPFFGVCVDEFSPRYALVSPWMPNGNLMQFMAKFPQDYLGKLVMVCYNFTLSLLNHNSDLVT